MPITGVMHARHSSVGTHSLSGLHAAALARERRTLGHVAGAVVAIGSLVALATTQLLSHHHIPASFVLMVGFTIATGIGFLMVSWDRIPAGWLHAIPLLATVETAVGIRLAGFYGDIAVNYYVFVGVFAAYAFTSRAAIAFHVAAASAASTLPLIYGSTYASHPGARMVVGIMLIAVIAAIVTLLREGLQARQRQLEELAVRDPLTGVGNYRLLSERLDYEIARHTRSGQPFAVMLLDLDGFKAINDTVGHLVGDRVLIEVANALTGSVRTQDTLARQGGDEFSILAPETDAEQAAIMATRVQEAVKAATSGSVGTSVGWVTFPHDAHDAGTLLNLADAQLRGAKQARERLPAPEASRRAGLLRLVESASG